MRRLTSEGKKRAAASAAIVFALFDATSVRLREHPLTPDRVKAALAMI
jgi:CO/xanthine dehydrogenase Mo-binding subunit